MAAEDPHRPADHEQEEGDPQHRQIGGVDDRMAGVPVEGQLRRQQQDLDGERLPDVACNQSEGQRPDHVPGREADCQYQQADPEHERRLKRGQATAPDDCNQRQHQDREHELLVAEQQPIDRGQLDDRSTPDPVLRERRLEDQADAPHSRQRAVRAQRQHRSVWVGDQQRGQQHDRRPVWPRPSASRAPYRSAPSAGARRPLGRGRS